VTYGNRYFRPDQKRIFISNNCPEVTFQEERFTKEEWAAIDRRITEVRIKEGEKLCPVIEECRQKKVYLRPEGMTSSWEEMDALFKSGKVKAPSASTSNSSSQSGKVKAPSASTSSSSSQVGAKRMKVTPPSHCRNLSDEFSSPEFTSTPKTSKNRRQGSNGSNGSRGSGKVKPPSAEELAGFEAMKSKAEAGKKLIEEAEAAKRRQEYAQEEHKRAEKKRTLDWIENASKVN